MKKAYRRFALVAAILLFFAILFSELFIICESDHDCIGDECPICAEISICENFMRRIGLSAAKVIFLVAVLHCFLGEMSAISNRLHISTPISLKVKLSN